MAGGGDWRTWGGVAGPGDDVRVDLEKVGEGVDGTSAKCTCFPGMAADGFGSGDVQVKMI